MESDVSDFNWSALFVITVVTLCIGGISFLIMWFLGFFHEERVELRSPPFGRLTIAYKYVRDHSKVKTIRRSQRREPLLGFKTIVVHYGEDFKLQSPTDNFKAYAVGVILSEDGTLPAMPVVHHLTLHGYKVVVFPRITHAIIATYKYKLSIDMHLYSSAVYPKLLSLMFERKLCAHPAVEIYEDKTKSVTFMLPLARQDDFYVSEFIQDMYASN